MSIYPLPLAPFEHLMLADDAPDHPMTFFIEMKFQGRFDPPRLHAALQTALKLHPLLDSRIRGSAADATSRIHWIPSDGSPARIDWNDDTMPIRFSHGRRIDLTSETGIRVWLREADTTTTLMLQIHHACCDGIGAASFIETVLMAYHRLHTAPTTAAMNGLFSPQLLRNRDPSCSTWKRIFKTAWHAISRVTQYCQHSPVPLATPRVEPLDDAEDDRLPRFHTITFDEAETEQIQSTAGRLGVSLNVMLMRDLFLTLDRWNRLHGLDHRSRPIRVCMPVNLRRSIDLRMPAANMVSLLFLDRAANQLADPDHLLGILQSRIDQTLRLRKHLAFIPALRVLGLFPGSLAARMRRSRCLASTVMTNLGVLGARSRLLGRDRRIVAGGVILESLAVILPVRPLTHAVFTALIYAGKLSLILSDDPHRIDATSGFELLESFAGQLKASSYQPASERLLEPAISH